MGLQRIPWALSGVGGATEDTMGSFRGWWGYRKCHVPFYGREGGGGGGLKKHQDRGGGLSEETIAFIHFGGP